MERKTAIKIGTGEARAQLAEAWFTFLKFVALTAIFHAAATKSDYIILHALKWACYLLLFGWTEYKINQLIWVLFPSVNPISKPRKNWYIAISVWISANIMIGVYFLVFYLIDIFMEFNKS